MPCDGFVYLVFLCVSLLVRRYACTMIIGWLSVIQLHRHYVQCEMCLLKFLFYDRSTFRVFMFGLLLKRRWVSVMIICYVTVTVLLLYLCNVSCIHWRLRFTRCCLSFLHACTRGVAQFGLHDTLWWCRSHFIGMFCSRAFSHGFTSFFIRKSAVHLVFMYAFLVVRRLFNAIIMGSVRIT